jgi:hypothetical protein
MKKRFEDFDINDLAKLRKEICLNSLYVSDYNNSFGISADSMCTFFDSYMSYLEEIAEEDNFDFSNMDYNLFFDTYDNIDNLFSWYNCYEDFSWVEYEEEDEEENDILFAA